MPATTTDLARAARVFHALSDETRLAVIDMLTDGERCVCELQAQLDAAQSRLSFHLKVLKDAGFLNDRREGRWNYYSLRPEVFADASQALSELKPSKRMLKVVAANACCN